MNNKEGIRFNRGKVFVRIPFSIITALFKFIDYGYIYGSDKRDKSSNIIVKAKMVK